MTIRLLAATNNSRGDLFTRLVKDLFFALGYDDLRLDVHKSGREIDIQGKHRLEPRRLVAECKAHADKMGGDELNKFFGVVTRERDRDERTPIAAYFISLSGFRETGKEQELLTSEQKRIILLDGNKVVDELVRSHILINQTLAAERAGRCAESAGLKDVVLDGTELLGHDLGYLWAVYYSRGKERTHVTLVHADGTVLADAVARGIIEADRECGGTLHQLAYLAPPSPAPDREALAKAAVQRYRDWLVAECGYIQLDGLPADADLTALRMKLERLFVPLRVIYHPSPDAHEDLETTLRGKSISVGKWLDTQPRFSLLAKPGGGKSTLLKRLAVAYGAPERRSETDDDLPEREWLPLFLRCRELRDRAYRPIRELLDDLPRHATLNEHEAALFRAQMDEALRFGRALLLIDGLDEISNEGTRTTFANHLRTFLAMFPNVAMIVTSREAGYRHVAGVIASACEQVTLAPFDEDDVERLCENWHVEVVGDNEKIRTEARELAATIWKNERIRALAENPLMLTTLLVVKRNVGELPTRRVKLYKAAIDVLIRTWNVEGYDPLDEEETLARLSYVACAMMNKGQQRIGRRLLLDLLRQAQAELQPELQFTSTSPSQFVERIEYRSSLLMQAGHDLIDDELQEVFEFRHLTFQEYLAARGFVEEQYPGREAGRTLPELLEPHFADERWREVIPLAAVLAGRKAESLIQQLTTSCQLRSRSSGYFRDEKTNPGAILLRQCLLDEVQVLQMTLRNALLLVARHMGDDEPARSAFANLRRGRFGEVLQEHVEAAYLSACPEFEDYLRAMRALSVENVFGCSQLHLSTEAGMTLESWLKSGQRSQQVRGAFVCMSLAFASFEGRTTDTNTGAPEHYQPLRDALGKLLSLDDVPVSEAAAWALAWMGAQRLPTTPPDRDVIVALLRLWREGATPEMRRFAAWAFSTQPLHLRNTFAQDIWGDYRTWFDAADTRDAENGRLVVAWYFREPWSDDELATRIGKQLRDDSFHRSAAELLSTLGDAGRRVLEAWNANQEASGRISSGHG